MTIKEIRSLSGLSQGKFCKKYRIPLATLQHWEHGDNGVAEYFLDLLERAVRADLAKVPRDPAKKYEYRVFEFNLSTDDYDHARAALGLLVESGKVDSFIEVVDKATGDAIEKIYY